MAPSPGPRQFDDRFTIIPDNLMTELHCYPCNRVVWISFHPSLDAVNERARQHNAIAHQDKEAA